MGKDGSSGEVLPSGAGPFIIAVAEIGFTREIVIYVRVFGGDSTYICSTVEIDSQLKRQ